MAKAKKPKAPTAEEFQDLAKASLGLLKLVNKLSWENRRLLIELHNIKEG